MEQVAKTSSTDAAQVARQLAMDTVYEAVTHRDDIRRQIHQAEAGIAMLEAHEGEADTSIVSEAQIEFELKHDPTIVDLNGRRSRIISPCWPGTWW